MKCRGQLITSLKIRTIGFAIRVWGGVLLRIQVCYSNIRETEDSEKVEFSKIKVCFAGAGPDCKNWRDSPVLGWGYLVT